MTRNDQVQMELQAAFKLPPCAGDVTELLFAYSRCTSRAWQLWNETIHPLLSERNLELL